MSEMLQDPSAAPPPEPGASPPAASFDAVPVAAGARGPLDRLAADPRVAAIRAEPAGPSGIDTRFRRLSKLAARLLDAPTAFVSLVDEQRRFFAGARGLTASIRQRQALPISETLCDHVAREGRVLAIADTHTHPVTLSRPALASETVRAYLGVPILDRVRGDVLGTLCATDGRPREWTAEQIAILEDIAAAAASEIGVRMVASQLEELHREQRFLAEVGAAVASSLDLRTLADTVLELTVEHFADHAAIELAAGGLAVARARPPEHADALLACLRTSASAVEDGPASISLDPAADGDERIATLRTLGAHDALVVPVGHGGRRGGTLVLVASTPGRVYSEVDLQLADEVGRLVGLAVENARLFAEARAAVQARDDMLSVVSHDLRNPLGVIGMAAQLLEDGGDRLDADGAVKYLGMIRRSADSAVLLVNDLLEVARLEARAYRPTLTPVAVRELIEEVLESQRPLADRSGVRLACELPEASRTLPADRPRLLRVFANLIGNALKFTPSGGHVTIGAGAEADGVRFFVADTGSGIPADNLDRLFTRFWQADAADQRGAGLGLAIVKAIVEAHDGRVWAESRLGDGTTIHFWIPGAAEPGGAAPE
ncbi:MAG TPA: ATP-binding protein [Longimicrobiales bacterium]|nr:ATP-binding protein [Longimicrobiales bacterium]